jgi:hypothetical protein
LQRQPGWPHERYVSDKDPKIARSAKPAISRNSRRWACRMLLIDLID